jgi:hypothetical protein
MKLDRKRRWNVKQCSSSAVLRFHTYKRKLGQGANFTVNTITVIVVNSETRIYFQTRLFDIWYHEGRDDSLYKVMYCIIWAQKYYFHNNILHCITQEFCFQSMYCIMLSENTIFTFVLYIWRQERETKKRIKILYYEGIHVLLNTIRRVRHRGSQLQVISFMQTVSCWSTHRRNYTASVSIIK